LSVLLLAGLAAWIPAHNILIESHEIPMEVGTYGRFSQNRSIFMWTPFDSTLNHWNLTGYPGGQWARVGLVDPDEGDPPAPESMAVDPPDPTILEVDTLGSGSVQHIYEDKDSFALYIDGIDFSQQGYRFIGNYIPDANVYVTPMYYGGGWISSITWQYEIIPGVPYQATEQHTKRICAKGKVKVPISGDYWWPCLVIRDNMIYYDNMGTNDNRWIYEWVVPGVFTGANGVAAACSQNGASKDFINVETFMQLSSTNIPGADVRPPQFSNTRVWPDTTTAGPFVVWSVIQDNDSVAEESLFYRVNLGEWVAVEPDSERADTFYFTIPEVTPPARIDYYIWARDEYCADNDIDLWTTWPVCSPESTMITFNSLATGVSQAEPPLPGRIGLSCSPNPFQGATTFYFAYPKANQAAIKVFATSGELVRSLPMQPGAGRGFEAQWDGHNEDGIPVPAGTYLYRVESGSYTETRKVTLTR
jgi:hypothetical protein